MIERISWVEKVRNLYRGFRATPARLQLPSNSLGRVKEEVLWKLTALKNIHIK